MKEKNDLIKYLIGTILGLSIALIVSFVTGEQVIVQEPIDPIIRLIIRDNKVDTLYVYSKP